MVSAEKIDIVGAGMSGLLAAIVLRNRAGSLTEAQPELPNNHSAVLRFRTNVVAEIIGSDFKAVDVVKDVARWRNPIADAMSYSIKANGTATMRSVLTADGGTYQRWVAPPDLIQRMFNQVSCSVAWDTRFTFRPHGGHRKLPRPVISTIPMPALMKELDYPTPRGLFDGKVRGAVNVKVKLANVDAYCSLYVPNPAIQFARASLTGNELILECPMGQEVTEYTANNPNWRREVVESGLYQFGFDNDQVISVSATPSRYAKILPIDESERRKFIRWATAEHGVYSLGRFACWRPKTMTDDLPHDVRQIVRLIDDNSNAYPHDLKGSGASTGR